MLLVVGLGFALSAETGASFPRSAGRAGGDACSASVAFAFITGAGPLVVRGPRRLFEPIRVHGARPLVLPALAVAGQALSQRWRAVAPVLVVALLVPIITNAGQFVIPPFGESFFDDPERVLTTAVRMPFAEDVPSDVHPIPDVYLPEGLDIGFLLDAEAAGKLQEPRPGDDLGRRRRTSSGSASACPRATATSAV